MTEPQPVQPTPPVPLQWEGSGQRVYANGMKLSAGAYDVLLTFGVVKHPEQADEVPTVTEVVGVSMSWAHLKSMIPVLARVVAEYEAKFGEVPAPGFGESWRA